MQYLDMGWELINQAELQPQIKKKSSSVSLHDSGSYALEDSGEYIGSVEAQEPTGKYVPGFTALFNKQCFAKLRMELVILTVIVCLMLSIAPKTVTRSYSEKDAQKFQHIPAANGGSYRLDYQQPQLIKPKAVQEPKLEQLTIPNSQNFVKQVEMMGDPIQFNSKLFLNWLRGEQAIYQAQFYRYHKKYNLDQPITQSSLCIISPFRNIVSSSEASWKLFIQSINSQNYSNYHVYLIDDYSTDNSTMVLLQEIQQKYPRLNNRLTVIRNLENKGALGNRDSTVRNHCKPGDIVIDVDGDDALIGKQVFNVVNRIYHNNPRTWFMYMNYLSVTGRLKGQARNINLEEKMQPGICKPIKPETFATNSYRTKISEWVTSQLRTYLRDLYVKIPLDYVIEQGTRSYFIEASDRFSMYALAQLAGSDHTLYVEQFVYFYFEPNFLILEQKECLLPQLFYSEAQARIMAPLLPLGQLSKPAQATSNYTVPTEIRLLYVKKLEQYLKCLSKQRREHPSLG